MLMKKIQIAFLGALVIGVLTVMALGGGGTIVAAGPVAQTTYTPRPEITPTPGAPVSPGARSASRPPRLHGTIFDWGKGNMPAGVQVVLSGDSWEMPVQTDKSGEYVYQDVGNEVAFLDVLVPADRQDLLPLTSGLPVRIQVDGELVVNMALYPEGTEPDPLLGLEIVASSPEAAGDEKVSYTITVVNYWDQGVNQVIVADHLPEGLSYIQATTSQGSVLYDQGLVWAELGPMAADSSATVTVMAQVGADVAPGTTILNRAAAYHSENTAVQGEVSIVIVEQNNHVLPVTGLKPMLPLAGIFLVVVVVCFYRLRRSAA
jgi:uncharacterized repeat protein (TIGR01451 family)